MESWTSEVFASLFLFLGLMMKKDTLDGLWILGLRGDAVLAMRNI